jgi:hypothetical protein
LAHLHFWSEALQQAFGQDFYENCAKISDAYDWKLYWNITATTPTTAHFKMVSNTVDGYAALGVWEQGGGFDLMTGHPSMNGPPNKFVDLWVLKHNGGGDIIDGWMEDDDPDKQGDTNNFQNRVVENNGTHMIATWSRLLVTSDQEDKDILLTGVTPMVYACHPTKVRTCRSSPAHRRPHPVYPFTRPPHLIR